MAPALIPVNNKSDSSTMATKTPPSLILTLLSLIRVIVFLLPFRRP